jgi:hypothetical protein
MSSKICYHIDKEHEIIFYYYHESITAQDFKEIELKLTSDPNFNKKYDQIHDLRYCNLTANLNEIKDYVRFVKDVLQVDDIRTEIYITSKPNEVALASIYEKLVDSFKFQPHIVSTLEKATQLLLKPNIDTPIIHNALEKLRHKA